MTESGSGSSGESSDGKPPEVAAGKPPVEPAGTPPVPATTSTTPGTQQIVSVSVAAFVGAVMVELADGPPENTSGWALLLVGAALLGLVTGGAVYPPIKKVIYKVGRIKKVTEQLTLRRLGTALAVLLTLALAYVTVPPALDALNRLVFGCPQATALTVLTSPGGLASMIEVVEDYRTWTESEDGGCAAVDAYVYATPDAEAVEAVARSWADEEDGEVNPVRDVGPRPDVWLPDSGVVVRRLNEQGVEQKIVDATVASSPVVLAVPDGAPARLPEPQAAWPDVVGQAAAVGIGVVRPDPGASAFANAATAALYGPAGPDRPETARAVERTIGQALDREGYPLADDPEVLCRHRQLADERQRRREDGDADGAPRTALILSERDVVRFNRGQALGGSCGAEDRPPVPAERLTAHYPQDLAVAQHLLRFRWTPEGSRRAEAATDLQEWLAEEPGRHALTAAGLRSGVADPVDAEVFVEAGAQKDPGLTPADTEPDTIDATNAALALARRPSRVLLALDVSGSMGKAAAPPDPATRLQVVTEGTGRAITALRGDDQVGLWFFPEDGSDRDVRRAVTVGLLDDPVGSTTRRDAIEVELRSATPAGNTPLFDTTADGVAELGPGDTDAVAKLVVVTDGEDTTSGRRPDELLDAVRDRQVRVFVIAIGGTSCAARPLEALTDETGGACFAESPADVGPRIARIIDE